MKKNLRFIYLIFTILLFSSTHLQAQTAKLWGTAANGGTNNGGVIFSFNPISEVSTKIFDFDNNGNPLGKLVCYKGKLYGTTFNGGANNKGTLYEFDTLTKIYTKKADFGSGGLGSLPYVDLILKNNKLYGTTTNPDSDFSGAGAIYEFDLVTGIITKKYTFNYTEGLYPRGGLVLYKDKFYGTAVNGGTNYDGVIFEWDPNTNIYTKKFDFTTLLGKEPQSSLTLVGDRFYGTTRNGGVSNDGVLFEWDPNTNVYTKKIDFNGAGNGSNAYAKLTYHNNKLYGLTNSGGLYNLGTLFEYDIALNTLKKLIDFGSPSVDGTYPSYGLTVSGGNLYSVSDGGVNAKGILFSFDPANNQFTKKVDFDGTNGDQVTAQLLEINGNHAPIINNKSSNQTVCSGSTASFFFKVDDEDGDAISFKATSSNQALLPNANISISNITGDDYKGTYATVNGQTGSTTITVTADDGSGGSDQISITVTTYKLSTSITAQKNVSCKGLSNGSATVAATGGFGAYSYSWNTNPVQTTATANNLAQGTYLCTVKDTGKCAVQQEVTIIELANGLSATITSQNNISCKGGNDGNVTLSVTGGQNPYTYDWNTTPAQNTATASNLKAGNYTCYLTDNNGCKGDKSVSITEPDSLKAMLSTQKNVSCKGGNDGSITLKPKGGTAPYYYNWNTSPSQATATISNLSAGTYTCTVTDSNNCITIKSVIITEPNAVLIASISSKQNIKCKGDSSGSATASATGGTNPYKYEWNTNPIQKTAEAANLKAGTYTCGITDVNNCTANTNVTITEPATGITSSILNQTSTKCTQDSTGSAIVQGSGGQGTLSYSWNTNPVQNTAFAVGLSAHEYICKITDTSQCSINQKVIITESFKLTTIISAQNNEKCKGDTIGSATVSVTTGTGPYTYSWNTSPAQTTATANNLAAGTYTCSITDVGSGCSGTQTASITEPKALTITVATKVDAGCKNTGSISLTVEGGTKPYIYSWSTNPIQSSAVAGGLAGGTYTCTIIDSNGCTKISAPTKILQQSGVSSMQELSICKGEEVRVGKNTYTQSGTYTDVLKTKDGCDSTITTKLNVTVIDTAVSSSSKTLTAQTSNAIYQWIDCQTNMPITGETSQNYTPKANGNYLVSITKDKCNERSSCHKVLVKDSVSNIIEEKKDITDLQIYPNPSTGIFIVKSSTKGTLLIRNELGQLIKTIQLTANIAESVDLSTLDNGMYYLIGINNKKKLVILR